MTDDRASDHWSFVRAGLPGVRLGSTPYAGYHSAGDVPAVVEPAQLRRTARIVVAWLAPLSLTSAGERTGAGRPDVAAGSPRRPRPPTGRGAKRRRVHLVGQQPDGLELAAPERGLRTTPCIVCSMKSMSKTKLPSECSTGTPRTDVDALHPVRVATDDEVGAGPHQRPPDLALHRLRGVGVLRAPVRQHHHDVGLPGGAAYGAQHPVEVRADQRTGARRHPHRQRSGRPRLRLAASRRWR